MKENVQRKTAKTCYEHLGGKLGELLMEHFVLKGWLVKQNSSNKNYFVSDKGVEGFSKIGIDLSKIN